MRRVPQWKIHSLPSRDEVTLSRALVSDANMSHMRSAEQNIHQGGFERKLCIKVGVNEVFILTKVGDRCKHENDIRLIW